MKDRAEGNKGLYKKQWQVNTRKDTEHATAHIIGIIAPRRYLQLRRHVPEADLSIMAAGDDGAEVVHDQQTADAVGGSCAAPQHYG